MATAPKEGWGLRRSGSCKNQFSLGSRKRVIVENLMRYVGSGEFHQRGDRRLSAHGQAVLRVKVAVTEFGEMAFTYASRGA
jgi:hypothetical protein